VTVSTLDAAPRATARGAVSNVQPDTTTVAEFTAIGQAIARANRPDYHRWLHHVRAAAGCSRPVQLVGSVDTVDPATGQRLHQVRTDELPDGAIYKACGNRRASVCPSCASLYQADAYQLLRAGLAGGKGVPDSVASHPAVFATFTAPSFGPVHTRVVARHTCGNRRRCDCRPNPCHARRDSFRCPHGRPTVCYTRHEPTDRELGQPLCLDCYDHDHQVVWNHFTGELWRRTKQAIERHLTALARRRAIPFPIVYGPTGKPRQLAPVRVSHGKVAEYQARAVVHFHALLRLDGVDPADPAAVVPPPAGITVDDLTEAVHIACAQIAVTTPPHPDHLTGWPVVWGEQLDVRPLTLAGRGDVTDTMAAGYLAKYATKSTEVTGHTSARLTPDTIDDYANPDGGNIARLIDACWRLGRPTYTPAPLTARATPHRPEPGFQERWTCLDCGGTTRLAVCPHCTDHRQDSLDTGSTKSARPNPYAGLRRWAHMLGFGGHFLTKARRYSTTFAVLRGTRIDYRRHEDTPAPVDGHTTADPVGEETTLVVGSLRYAGSGWHTAGDALLANTAAAMARERQRVAREELAHEAGSTSAVPVLTAA